MVRTVRIDNITIGYGDPSGAVDQSDFGLNDSYSTLPGS